MSDPRSKGMKHAHALTVKVCTRTECPAAFCRNCSKMFRSTTDPAYHHFTSCTQRSSAKRGNNTTNSSSNIQRYDRPKFKPRTNVAIEQEQDQDDYEQEQDSEDSFFL